MLRLKFYLVSQYGQFCGKDDKEKLDADFHWASYDLPEDRETMMGRSNSNTSVESASGANTARQALLNYPPKDSAAGSPGASSNGSGSQAASSSSHPAAGKLLRAASQHNQGSIRKAPQLDIPEHGLHPGYGYGHGYGHSHGYGYGLPVSIVLMPSSLHA